MATRELKFRAWNKILDVMVTNHCQLITYGVDAPTFHKKDVMARGDEYEWMQYTGIEDKNGAEIYEGDIVKFQLIARPAETYIVEWGHFGFTYKGRDDGDHYLQQAYLEVIGNIYENEDLL